jgi:hypothetical protein
VKETRTTIIAKAKTLPMFVLRLECASITTLRPHQIGVLDPLGSIHLLVCWKFGIVQTTFATFAVSAILDIEQSAHFCGVRPVGEVAENPVFRQR